MVIYLDLDDDDYVYGWGTDDGVAKVELGKNHDFFKAVYQGAYKYLDGNLVYDEEKERELIEQQKKEQSKLDREERNEMAMLELANLVAELKGEL